MFGFAESIYGCYEQMFGKRAEDENKWGKKVKGKKNVKNWVDFAGESLYNLTCCRKNSGGTILENDTVKSRSKKEQSDSERVKRLLKRIGRTALASGPEEGKKEEKD